MGTLLSSADLRAIEQRLLRERERALRSMHQLQGRVRPSREGSDSDLPSYSLHMADQGTDAMEREKALHFAGKEGRYLYRVEDALRRLYREPETFGRCHGCGGGIPFERLDALPHARYCLDCKLREEEGGA